MNSKYIRIILSFIDDCFSYQSGKLREKPAVQTESPSPSGSPVPEAPDVMPDVPTDRYDASKTARMEIMQQIL